MDLVAELSVEAILNLFPLAGVALVLLRALDASVARQRAFVFTLLHPRSMRDPGFKYDV